MGGVAVAPLLPGLIQHLKGRMQGRRGPSPWQPYRELARLWTRSAVSPEGTTIVYRLAPAIVAASLAMAVLVVPVAGRAPAWPTGHDALVVVGLLALARFALALSSWDTSSGFALMCAARDLTLGVAVEGLLLLVIVIAALPAGSTDLLVAEQRRRGSRHLGGTLPLARGSRLHSRRHRRDRPPAGRQSRHSSRTDHDPRGTPLGVRGPRPRLPAVGGSRPPLGRAGPRLRAVPAPPRILRRPTPRARRRTAGAVCRPWRSSRAGRPRCGSCASPRLMATGAALCLLGLMAWFAGGTL